MMTFARFDSDRAQLVIQVWDATLHFTVLFKAADLAAQSDEVMRDGLRAWRDWQETKSLTSEQLRLMRTAQEHLLDRIRECQQDPQRLGQLQRVHGEGPQ